MGSEPPYPGTTCSLTTEPNELVRPVHNRMPVIIPRESFGEWLDPTTPERRLKDLLVPFPADLMTVREVSPRVNKAGVEGPECLAAPEGVARDSLLVR
ncbi:MAG TPA: SOS response-associated peptidase family protein [Urbifossiella sp.]|nr:SOS response-associated peptidase family protein [Urbifossiella sp.]